MDGTGKQDGLYAKLKAELDEIDTLSKRIDSLLGELIDEKGEH